MRTRAVAAATLASAGVIAAGWQLGVQPAIAVQSQQTGTSASTGSGSAAGQGPAAPGGTSNSTSSGNSTSGSAGSGSATSGSSGSTPGTTSGSSAGSASSSDTATDGTFTGQSVSTRFGNVQVQVTISSGKITEVTALQLTDDDSKSRMISNRAAPVLRSEVLQAQSANVNTVGGATYTSEAYLTSLQSALDSAHFPG